LPYYVATVVVVVGIQAPTREKALSLALAASSHNLCMEDASSILEVGDYGDEAEIIDQRVQSLMEERGDS
jgi:hypothetical protein